MKGGAADVVPSSDLELLDPAGRSPSSRFIRLLAPWLEPREAPLSLLEGIEARLGLQLPPELEAWVALFSGYYVEPVDLAEAELVLLGAYGDMATELRSGRMGYGVDLLGLLTGTSLVIQQGNLSYLAGWAASDAGEVEVYAFHPEDWGLELCDRSLGQRVSALLRLHARSLHPEGSPGFELDAQLVLPLQPPERAPFDGAPLPRSLGPAALWRRADWLLHSLLGRGRQPIELSLAEASSYARYERERELLSVWPQLGLYWLWSHFFLQNEGALAECLAIDNPSEALAQSKALILGHLEHGHAVGQQSRAMLAHWRETLLQLAPPALREPKARRQTRDRSLWQSGKETHPQAGGEAKTRAERLLETIEAVHQELEAEIQGDRLAKEALHRLTPELAGALEPVPMSWLAERVDARFTPLVLLRLHRSLRVKDGHPEALPGVILAWAKLAGDFESFETELLRVGLEKLQNPRLAEFYQALAGFEDKRATQALARAAQSWLMELEDWPRMTPIEAVHGLLSRDSLETHEFVAALLKEASFGPQNAEVAMEAVRAAGRFGVKRAVFGLKRAVQRGLGYVGDGSRSELIQIWVRLAGLEAEALLREIYGAPKTAQSERSMALAGLLALAAQPEWQTPAEIEIWQAAALTRLSELAAGLHRLRHPAYGVLGEAAALVTALDGFEDPELRAQLRIWRDPPCRLSREGKRLIDGIRRAELESPA